MSNVKITIKPDETLNRPIDMNDPEHLKLLGVTTEELSRENEEQARQEFRRAFAEREREAAERARQQEAATREMIREEVIRALAEDRRRRSMPEYKTEETRDEGPEVA